MPQPPMRVSRDDAKRMIVRWMLNGIWYRPMEGDVLAEEIYDPLETEETQEPLPDN